MTAEFKNRRPDLWIRRDNDEPRPGYIVGLRPDQGKVVVRSQEGQRYHVDLGIYTTGKAQTRRGSLKFIMTPLPANLSEILKDGS